MINSSYVPVSGQIQLDSDSDGIYDLPDVDGVLGLSPYSPFSLQNGLGDLTVFAAGLTQVSHQRFLEFGSCTHPALDADADGLSDCAEKIVLKTNPEHFDTDGDGIPDELELRFGINPLDPSDAFLNAVGDEIPNIRKIQMQLPLRETASAKLKEGAHQYQLVPMSKNNLGQFCFDLKVKPIPIVDAPHGNLILTYVLEKSIGSQAEGGALPSRMNRCCSVVPKRVQNGAEVVLLWGQSTDLVCPCPLELDLKE